MYLFELWFSLGICPGVRLLGHIVVLFFLFFKEPPYCFSLWLYNVIYLCTACTFMLKWQRWKKEWKGEGREGRERKWKKTEERERERKERKKRENKKEGKSPFPVKYRCLAVSQARWYISVLSSHFLFFFFLQFLSSHKIGIPSFLVGGSFCSSIHYSLTCLSNGDVVCQAHLCSHFSLLKS